MSTNVPPADYYQYTTALRSQTDLQKRLAILEHELQKAQLKGDVAVKVTGGLVAMIKEGAVELNDDQLAALAEGSFIAEETLDDDLTAQGRVIQRQLWERGLDVHALLGERAVAGKVKVTTAERSPDVPADLTNLAVIVPMSRKAMTIRTPAEQAEEVAVVLENLAASFRKNGLPKEAGK